MCDAFGLYDPSTLQLGDKIQRGGGANTRYMLEVESNGLNEAAARPYMLHCASGSGTTLGDMVLVNAPALF